MIWIIGLAVVVFVLIWKYKDEKAMAAFSGLLAAGLGIVVALLVGVIFPGGVHSVSTTTRLQSLADGSSQIHGSFFLGSGTVNSEPVYTWYEQTGPNSYVQRQANANHATIHYLTGGRPHVVRWHMETKVRPGLKAFRWVLDHSPDYDDSYDFYVPRGTIKQNFILGSH